MYTISIGWILYLFYDIQKYIKDLNASLENEENSYTGGRSGTGEMYRARELYGDILMNKMNRDPGVGDIYDVNDIEKRKRKNSMIDWSC